MNDNEGPGKEAYYPSQLHPRNIHVSCATEVFHAIANQRKAESYDGLCFVFFLIHVQMILEIYLESAAVMTCFSKPSAERLGCLKRCLVWKET